MLKGLSKHARWRGSHLYWCQCSWQTRVAQDHKKALSLKHLNINVILFWCSISNHTAGLFISSVDDWWWWWFHWAKVKKKLFHDTHIKQLERLPSDKLRRFKQKSEDWNWDEWASHEQTEKLQWTISNWRNRRHQHEHKIPWRNIIIIVWAHLSADIPQWQSSHNITY